MRDRYHLSDRSAAALATALQDVGIINSSETENIIDKNKTEGQKSNCGKI